LRAFKKKMVKRLFVPKKELQQDSGDNCITVISVDLYPSPNFIRAFTSRRTRGAEHM
jgi:hypothetical protein